MTPDARTPPPRQADEADRDALRQALYGRVCESYHGIEDFRMKLLGLLPVATGTGVFLLLSGKADLLGDEREQMSDALLAIGIFGFVFTCGLFAYELFGIKKCHYLIVVGTRLETAMQMPGQFRSRPRDLAGFINEPFASAFIYPASMAAWVYLAFALRCSGLAAAIATVAIFVGGLIATLCAARRIKTNQDREDVILKLVWRANNKITLSDLRKELTKHHDGVEPKVHWLSQARTALRRDWVERTVDRLLKQRELEEQEPQQHKGQKKEQAKEDEDQKGQKQPTLQLDANAQFRVTLASSETPDDGAAANSH